MDISNARLEELSNFKPQDAMSTEEVRGMARELLLRRLREESNLETRVSALERLVMQFVPDHSKPKE